ncbi:hypothetical protein [Dyadobacter psychrotolerans]|uniref:Uncharacterized protein n=1 Tax=Dyadobacter psychrotolerans TaxID=2541721 RepID=A0A4R5DE59_9BACT|nr:hypothetical protein [Dyadobacter psychrotolerans]TDE12079.1 hypothetical protein E0F88_23835 [Dyadobacter psychrotolerans]
MSQSLDSSVKLSKPFSSNTDEEKESLIYEANLYRDKLEDQWGDLKSDAKQYGKQALIIGGVVTTTFLVLNALLPDTKKKEKEIKGKNTERPQPVAKEVKVKKSSENTVKSAVQSLAWTLAIGWARQKLEKYIADDRKTE